MTPHELAAIRARDADAHSGDPNYIPMRGVESRAFADRRALLAEVDRLTDEAANNVAWHRAARAGALAERARIRAGVEGLRLGQPDDPDKPDPWWDGWHEALERVLRVIDGGEA